MHSDPMALHGLGVWGHGLGSPFTIAAVCAETGDSPIVPARGIWHGPRFHRDEDASSDQCDAHE